MPPGKLASQAGHAFTNTIMLAQQTDNNLANEYETPYNIGTKVVLKSKNLNHILRAHEQAKEAGLSTTLIVDSGHVMPPYFDGEPIVTALGIGPARRDQIEHITKKFNCLD